MPLPAGARGDLAIGRESAYTSRVIAGLRQRGRNRSLHHKELVVGLVAMLMTVHAPLVAAHIKGPWVQEKEALKDDNSGHGMLFRGTLLFIVHHAEGNGPRKPQSWNDDDSVDELLLGDRLGP